MGTRPLADHGTRARYIHHRNPCHCPECTAANTRYVALWRQAGPTEHRTWPDPGG